MTLKQGDMLFLTTLRKKILFQSIEGPFDFSNQNEKLSYIDGPAIIIVLNIYSNFETVYYCYVKGTIIKIRDDRLVEMINRNEISIN